jgi:hypothetical protein
LDVTVPAGTTVARFSLSEAAADADLDLYVYRGVNIVAASGTAGSDEEVTLTNPFPAVYTVYVQGFAVNGSSPFTLHSWVVGADAPGNVTLTAPTTAAVGATGNIGLSFGALAPDTKYLGTVSYAGVPGTAPAPTIVRVDVPAGQ